MTKLTLNLETLKVETFEANAANDRSRGTVIGAELLLTGPQNCVTISCGDSEIRACYGW
jgi:hypothetical protein